MPVPIDDPHFRVFASSLEKAIGHYKQKDTKDFLQRQKEQVDLLVKLEKDFRLTLIAHSEGVKIYKKFVKFICDDLRNILAARPYFRERQSVFTREIGRALHRRSERSLFRYAFNFRFVQFVLQAKAWKPKSKLVLIANQIAAVRQELITMNMPLAISRARIFFRRTPQAHLSYMDLIQIACEGLMSGIDKFVPPFSKAFRAVAIGRMVGNFIEQYSETLVHFFPTDKRKIYRANKLSGKRAGTLDFEEVAKHVNKGVEKHQCTTAAEIANLMAAASTVSADALVGGDDDEEGATRLADRFAAPASWQPDVQVERHDAMKSMGEAAKVLTPFDRKILRLRGVRLDSLY